MRPRVPLSPLGAARASLLGSGERGFSPEVLEALSRYNLGEEAAFLAWELARCVRGLSDGEERALFLLVLASIVNLHQGSTRLPVRGPQATLLAELLRPLGGAGAEDAVGPLLDDPRLAPILGVPGDYKPLLLEGDFLYHQRTLHFEERLVHALAERLARPPFPLAPSDVARALAEVRERPAQLSGKPVELSAEQEYAALTALHAPLAVITGGPGTGKTSIVVTILRLLVRLGVPASAVALAAPTGKAANRMNAAVRASLDSLGELDAADALLRSLDEPRTLHRLLGYSPGQDRFRHHAHNRLGASVVIVDECSMIDLFLMDQLLHAVPTGARLVLLGDAEQLPSVEAGAVFRSLLPEGRAGGAMPWRELVRPTRVGALPPLDPDPSPDPRLRAAVRLTHSYRMDSERREGRNILEVARHINEGREASLFAPEGREPREGEEVITERAQAADVAFRKVELLTDDSAAGREALLVRWFDERVASLEGWDTRVRRVYRAKPAFGEQDARSLLELFQHYDSLRILTLTREGARGAGADGVNQRLHEAMLRRAGQGEAELTAGEPVMVQHNDYDRQLFNGDQGVVLSVDAGDGPRPTVVFRRGASEFSLFRLEALRAQIRLSFAMTVHKSQGSEFEHIALFLPRENLPLFTRELLYTAITRSKTSVVIVGQKELLKAGASQPILRFSGIAEKLAGVRG